MLKPALTRALPVIGVLAGTAQAGPPLTVCTDFGCRSTQTVTVDMATWQAVAGLFDGVDSAPAERAAVARAVARLEAGVGRQTGTWRDRAYNWQRAGEPGELDCIAESTNTSRYLAALQDAGLLRWHRTGEAVMRGIFLVHWTAVLQANADGGQWAVDSWFRDNGLPPVILPLAQWYDYKGPGT